MPFSNPAIKNVIFDLGGVLLNLSVPATLQAFAGISGKPLEEVKAAVSRPEFLDYEKGLISDAEFRTAVRDHLQTDASDDVIDSAWNAMLGDIPRARLALLEQLKTDYRTFLLSNTNGIHVQAFTARLHQDHKVSSLDHYFEKVYYSHVMKLRKPDVVIYEAVLSDSGLHAEESLFLDDNLHNIEGAREAGLNAIHITHPDMIFDLFS
ncbi:MAG: HAD family phosphatase [Cyclobacteriaceae bacterium]|nr:HAD family phosphatase [Cyclobacteriaceae bacterium]